MLYYRTTPARNGPPPELVGYTSTGPAASLHEQLVDGRHVVGVTPPLAFDPPATGWVPLAGASGWEVASKGPFVPAAHGRLGAPWLVSLIDVEGIAWAAPHVLTPAGERGFRVSYGGPDFAPRLTPEQQQAYDLAREVRTALDGNILPDMPVQARWAARFVQLVYHLSDGTLQLIGMPEALITQTLRVAAGHYELRG